MDIRNAANDDRIAQILNLALRIGERRPRGKAGAVWIARSREVDPVAIGTPIGEWEVRGR